jgi:hypothetical protein
MGDGRTVTKKNGVAQSLDDFVVGAYDIRPFILLPETGTCRGARLAPLQE